MTTFDFDVLMHYNNINYDNNIMSFDLCVFENVCVCVHMFMCMCMHVCACIYMCLCVMVSTLIFCIYALDASRHVITHSYQMYAL